MNDLSGFFRRCVFEKTGLRQSILFFKREKALRAYFRDIDYPRCLNLGCGGNLLPGWFNTDIGVSVGQNDVYYLDATKKYPFPDDSFDYIFLEHLFEHIELKNAVEMLHECKRVLRKNGVLRITLPTMEFLLDLYYHPDNYRDYIKWEIDSFLPDVKNIFQGEYPEVFVINNFYRAWGHRVIYDCKTLELLLLKSGYTDIKRCNVRESNHSVLQNIEQHDQKSYSGLSDIESIVIEAGISVATDEPD